MISEDKGISAVRAARAAAVSETAGTPYTYELPEEFGRESGVFVTFSTYPDGELRGCIGYPLPYMPLAEALEASARSACHDPRFPDLAEDELGRITVEVTVLTVPEKVPVAKEELPGWVEIGKHGLMIECLGRRGLLLPQVPAEWGWNSREYLEHLSVKAGLPPGAWKRADAEIYSFEGEIFHETEPDGRITRG